MNSEKQLNLFHALTPILIFPLLGTVGIMLRPWGVPSIFAYQVLGVDATALLPFIFFAFLVPAINIILGYLNISIAKKDYIYEAVKDIL